MQEEGKDAVMEMGREIRRLRTARGLTQEALAAALNVTAQTVSKWECGTSVPDVQMLPEIAVFFGITPVPAQTDRPAPSAFPGCRRACRRKPDR